MIDSRPQALAFPPAATVPRVKPQARRIAAPAPILPAATPLLYLYFIGLYIRPQDWWGPLYLWPIDWMIFGALFMCLPLYFGLVPRLLQGHVFKVLMLWLVVIAASNIVHGELWYARMALTLYLRHAIVFGSLLIFLVQPPQLRRIVWFIVILTALIAWQTVDQVATGVGWAGQTLSWDDGFGMRPKWVGLWDGPNVLCLLFVLVYPFLFEFALASFLPLRLVSMGLAALIMYAIALTQSRGGFLALGVAVSFSILLRFKRTKALPAFVAGLMLLVVFAPARMSNLDDRGGSKSGYNRLELWSAGLQMAKENPVLGVGKTRWMEVISDYSDIRLIAHNSLVQILGETGLLGLSVYIALSYLVIKGLWRVRGSPSLSPIDQAMARAFLASACSYAMQSLFITTDFDLFYVQLAMASAFLASHQALPSLTRRDVCIIGCTSLGFVVGIYALVQTFY